MAINLLPCVCVITLDGHQLTPLCSCWPRDPAGCPCPDQEPRVHHHAAGHLLWDLYRQWLCGLPAEIHRVTVWYLHFLGEPFHWWAVSGVGGGGGGEKIYRTGGRVREMEGGFKGEKIDWGEREGGWVNSWEKGLVLFRSFSSQSWPTDLAKFYLQFFLLALSHWTNLSLYYVKDAVAQVMLKRRLMETF